MVLVTERGLSSEEVCDEGSLSSLFDCAFGGDGIPEIPLERRDVSDEMSAEPWMSLEAIPITLEPELNDVEIEVIESTSEVADLGPSEVEISEDTVEIALALGEPKGSVEGS